MTYGGRWNHKGTRVVYLAESRSLAAMEMMVHVDRTLLKTEYNLIQVDFDDQKVAIIANLPDGWDNDVPIPETADIGTQWVQLASSLLLRVPSAVIKGEYNYLLNPGHPDMNSLRISEKESFFFDKRLSDDG